jgi:hypothetical protein
MRVDPPLTDEGKKSIAAAEKTLEDSKEDYDKKKVIAQSKELEFHAAARISKAAREERAKAEDRYYIQSKAARKAARYAENMEREAQKASARQAAADKFQEVIATSNKAASAKEAAAAPAKPAAAAAPAKAAVAQAPAAAAAPAKSAAQVASNSTLAHVSANSSLAAVAANSTSAVAANITANQTVFANRTIATQANVSANATRK